MLDIAILWDNWKDNTIKLFNHESYDGEQTLESYSCQLRNLQSLIQISSIFTIISLLRRSGAIKS